MFCAEDDEPCVGVQPERTAAPAPAATPLVTKSRLLRDFSRFLVMSVPPGFAVGNELEPTYRSRRSSQRRGDARPSYHRDDTFTAAAMVGTASVATGNAISLLGPRADYTAERGEVANSPRIGHCLCASCVGLANGVQVVSEPFRLRSLLITTAPRRCIAILGVTILHAQSVQEREQSCAFPPQ